MRLSIVTPLFNCLPLTQAMLASLRATLPPGLDHEIIFVDDGSTDGTREWLAGLTTAADAGIRVLLQDRNGGFAVATNRGAAVATGDMLALLNNDLVLEPGWLEPMLDVLARQPRATLVGNVQTAVTTGAIHHAGIYIDPRGKPAHDRVLPRDGAAWRRTMAVTAACLLVPREDFRALGGFDEAYVNGCEDVDLCLRARRTHRHCYVALRSRVGHHVSASPGRSTQRLRNACRLMLAWRHILPSLAGQAWRDPHLRRAWERRLTPPERLLARRHHPRGSREVREFPDSLRALVQLRIRWQLLLWSRQFPELRHQVVPHERLDD